MSLLSSAANGVSVLFLLLVLIGIVYAAVYVLGSLLVYILVSIPAIPIDRTQWIRYRESKSRILNLFNYEFGHDVFGLLALVAVLTVVVGFLAFVGMVAELLGVSIV